MKSSPCINFCKIQNDLCIGCCRTIDHISEWSTLSNYEKKEINLNIKKYKKIILFGNFSKESIKNKIIKNSYVFFLTSWDDLLYLCKNKAFDLVVFEDKVIKNDKYLEIFNLINESENMSLAFENILKE